MEPVLAGVLFQLVADHAQELWQIGAPIVGAAIGTAMSAGLFVGRVNTRLENIERRLERLED